MGAAALELENSKCFCCCHLLYYISKSKVYNRRALIRGSVDQSRKKWASENVTFSGCRFSHCDVAGVIFGQFSPTSPRRSWQDYLAASPPLQGSSWYNNKKQQ